MIRVFFMIRFSFELSLQLHMIVEWFAEAKALIS
jgi:hypothetical protein